VFYVLTWQSGVLAIGCAIFAALLFGALASLFTPWGLPALTLPFCFATLTFVLMKGSTPKLEPIEVADITTRPRSTSPARAASARTASAATRSPESPEAAGRPAGGAATVGSS
jgi:hypothetical protein